MFSTSILNPTTGRTNRVVGWHMSGAIVSDWLRQTGGTSTARDLGLALLNDSSALQLAETEEGGDAADNNFALSVFEGGLDWGLGIAALGYCRAIRQQYAGKRAGRFDILANRKGDVFIRLPKSGKIIDWSAFCAEQVAA